VVNANRVAANGQYLTASGLEKEVGRRGLLHTVSKRQALFDGCVVEEQIIAVHADRRPCGQLRRLHPSHMVHVCVGKQDVPYSKASIGDDLQQVVDLVSGVDQNALPRFFAPDHETVLEEGGGGPGF
jgi:hypothetical protein